MAFFNDMKKLLFGAKAVTKSAADKAVEATKETGSELWDKVQETAETVAEKTKDFVTDLTGKEGKPAENIDTAEVMDEIMAEREAVAPAAGATEETLELPPLRVPADAPKLLDDGNPDNNPDYGQSVLDSLKNTGATVIEKSGEALDKAADFTEGVGKKVMETGSEWAGKIGEKAEHIGGAILEKSSGALDRAADFTEGVGKKVMETSSDWAEKFGEKAEDVGEAIFEKGGEALDRAKDLAAGLGSKILKAKDDLFARAQAEAEKSGETTGSLIDKAKELNQKLEDKITGNNAKFADKPLDTGGSEFAKHDSFWEKADRFSKGDYQMKGEPPLKPGEVKIKPGPDAKLPEKRKDDDHDDLIDDAIVEK
ncbi:MAG: hypothetical protein HY842_04190 [Bacteroidetes bacterium]|nr:hypothetical protein [Bacteroidota bacterium]